MRFDRPRIARELTVTTTALLLAAALLPTAETAAAPQGKRWTDMNYGPYLTAAIEITKGNIAHKGLAIRLDAGDGGVAAGREFCMFDTDTLRYAGAWSGAEFTDWRSIVFDGSHGTHPKIVGDLLYENRIGPGWADADGGFDDPRVRGRDDVAYGPLPREWARWKGLYLHENHVVLNYTVGRTEILELPGVETVAGVPVFTRTIELGPRSAELVLQVAQPSSSEIKIETGGVLAGLSSGGEESTAAGARRLDGTTSLEIAGSKSFNLTDEDFTISARIRTKKGGTILARAPARGNWAPDAVALFVRNGRVCFDVGWVGVVVSKRRVDDGEWHDVAATFDQATGRIQLYVDGEADSGKELQAKNNPSGHVVRIGFASPDFPKPSAFSGSIREVRLYQRRLDAAQLAAEATKDAQDLLGRWILSDDALPPRVDDVSGGKHHATARAIAANRPSVSAAARPTAFVVVGDTDATTWSVDPANRALRLRIAAGDDPLRFKIGIAAAKSGAALDLDAIRSSLRAPGDIRALTRGGPGRWNETLNTKVSTLGSPEGPYVAEVISTPLDNPYRAWMRLGGFDFFADGKRAAVCTWMGDVWTVDGLGGELETFRWRRIATGLYQALGLKIVDETVYVLGRDQITRLHDLNGDGEIDFYENFNNDVQNTEHFHEFAMDLQTDAAGNFYFMKGGRHALDAVIPHHGTVRKVSKDGATSSTVAYGFRAPNGLYVHSSGSFVTSDQEGHWTPANRINWVKPGGFYGYNWSYHADGTKRETYDPPLCWIHPKMDRSPAAQLFVESDRWGPLGGKLLSLSYGTGNVLLVLNEEVNGTRQGGVVRLPVEMFPTGIMRGRFHPGDGQLYACGLFGWAGNRTQAGGFYRIRYTGKPLDVPTALHATDRGLVLEFSRPLDPRRAADARRYAAERWNYKWQQQYGSKDYRLTDGSIGRDKVKVTEARLSKDGRKLFLAIDDMKPCMQMWLRYRITAADGARVQNEIYHTVHALGASENHLEGF